MRRIELFFDVISPYSWVAFEALLRLQPKWDIEVVLKPFFLHTIMRNSGNRPPATVPAKGMYMLNDLTRNGKFWGVDISNPPSEFMIWIRKYTTKDALKILLVLQRDQPDLFVPVARGFWTRLWTEGQKIFEEQDFVQVLKKAGVRNIPAVLNKIHDEDIEKILEKNTAQAEDQGAFGAPWIVVHDEHGVEHSFFGADRFHFIAHLLDVPQPTPISKL